MTWTEIRRADGRTEWECEHSVGHGPHIHGCDGCCHRGDYPGPRIDPEPRDPTLTDLLDDIGNMVDAREDALAEASAADRALARNVEGARVLGATWPQIAARLGLASGQAAQTWWRRHRPDSE